MTILQQPDWHDFGLTFASEQLAKRHGIEVRKETLRKLGHDQENIPFGMPTLGNPVVARRRKAETSRLRGAVSGRPESERARVDLFTHSLAERNHDSLRLVIQGVNHHV